MTRFRATLQGNVPLTPEELMALEAMEAEAAKPKMPSIEDFDKALTAHLDATAQARRYDDRISCMVRAGFAGPFQAEGIAFAEWADTCNAIAYSFLAEVQAGTRSLPDTTQSLIEALPPMEWPA